MITFEPGSHTYRWDGQIIPSVTQILGDNGHISDFCKSQKHADRGTEIHEAISLSISGDNPDRLLELEWQYSPELAQWNEFSKETGFRVIHNECIIHGHTSYYYEDQSGCLDIPEWTGTLDLYGLFSTHGWEAIVDVKTGSSAPPHTSLQTAAYAMGIDPLGYRGIKRFSLRINGKGKYKLKEYQDPDDYRRWAEEVKRWQRNQAQASRQ